MGNRSNVRAASAFMLIVASLGAAFGACTQYKSANGESCLKDEDCLAGSCIAGYCALPTPNPAEDAGTLAVDGASDSAGDALAPGDSGGDTSTVTPTDSGPGDAGQDAIDASNDTNTPDTSDDTDAADGATGARETLVDSFAA